MMTLFNSILFIKLIPIAYCDAPHSWQWGIQDAATPVLESMLSFHNYLIFFLIIIGVLVFYFLVEVVLNFTEDKNGVSNRFTHSSSLEIIWTVVPAFCLVIIAIPSFTLLYSLDDIIDSDITLKVLGHQWYWSYEYSDGATDRDPEYHIAFDSYMVPTNDLVEGSFRLLETDTRVVLPESAYIRTLISATDVIHSWAIPSFGIKVDACPGRLSQASIFIKREGVFLGQCSEICGVNHGFMPIVVVGTDTNTFNSWYKPCNVQQLKLEIPDSFYSRVWLEFWKHTHLYTILPLP